jgi:hypothetical protein
MVVKVDAPLIAITADNIRVPETIIVVVSLLKFIMIRI